MPTFRKCTPFCLSYNQPGLGAINRKNPCDGYFGCDDEEIFQDDDKALLNKSSHNGKPAHSFLPWAKRKSPPVVSFFKRMASLRKQQTPKQKKVCSGYRTLPNPKTQSFNVGYRCFPFDAGFTSLKRNYCCDGYFGCPSSDKN